MKNTANNAGKSRRRFLNLGLLFSVGMFSSGKIQARALGDEEKVRLITADGKVLEVEKSRIPNFGQAIPVSDAELEQWKETHKE